MVFRSLPLMLAVVLCACAEKPGSSGPSEAVVRVHADVLVLREEVRIRGGDSSALLRGTDSLLDVHAVSRESYASALGELREDLTAWKAFNERVARRLDTLQRLSQAPDTGAAAQGRKRISRQE